ncbi:MAG: Cna B-type domain-containing protein [Firmicutes bacterium]|nr:Cna B-type domain-containing protein [Bacillota bacterium]
MAKVKVTPILLVIIMCMMCMLPQTIWAAQSIDLTQTASLTIAYNDDGKALTGADFDVYRIADVSEDGVLKLESRYEGYGVSFDVTEEQDWRGTAAALQGYILRDNIEQDYHGETNKNGQCTFDGLSCGLYLVIGYRHVQSDFAYECEPALIVLPTPDEAGTLQYSVTVNPKTEKTPMDKPEETSVNRKVLKVWKDGDAEDRPAEITVDLLKDGKVYDTVKLNDDNQWKYTWTDLSANYSWNVVEREVEGYTVKTTREGTTFVITNTKEGPVPDGDNVTPDEDETLPLTGQPWVIVAGLLAVGLLCVCLGLLIKKGGNDEA